MKLYTPPKKEITGYGLTESIPNKSSLKLCLEWPYGIQQGSVDGNPDFVYFWESKLGLPDRLDFEYPRIAGGNRALCASRQMNSVIGNSVRFGKVGLKAEYLVSTWTPSRTSPHTLVWLMNYANTSQQCSMFLYSDISSFRQQGYYVGNAFKKTFPPESVGYGTITPDGIQANKNYVCHLQYDPVSSSGSKFWVNGVEIEYLVPFDFTAMPPIDFLVVGGEGDFYIKGLWGFEGLVNPTDIFKYAKKFAISQGITI